MSRIQNVQSAPAYINEFIRTNMGNLTKIYDEGLQSQGVGCLGFVCSQNENRMDVQYFDEARMCEILAKESWMQLKGNLPENKKLFFIMDNDVNSVFLVYI
jgi:hypothetical protein